MEQKFNSIKNALKETFGEGTEITKKSSVFGGDINDSYKMLLSSGETVFLKTNSVANFDFFTAVYSDRWSNHCLCDTQSRWSGLN